MCVCVCVCVLCMYVCVCVFTLMSALLQIPHIIASHVLHYTLPTQYKDQFRYYPDKDGLKPHPWGNKRWVSEVTYALNYLGKVKSLHMFYYYPLLARHSSDANTEGI